MSSVPLHLGCFEFPQVNFQLVPTGKRAYQAVRETVPPLELRYALEILQHAV